MHAACGWRAVNASTWCAHAVTVSSLERWIWQSVGGCDVCVAVTGGHDGRVGSECVSTVGFGWCAHMQEMGSWGCVYVVSNQVSGTEQKWVFSGDVARDA